MSKLCGLRSTFEITILYIQYLQALLGYYMLTVDIVIHVAHRLTFWSCLVCYFVLTVLLVAAALRQWLL